MVLSTAERPSTSSSDYLARESFRHLANENFIRNAIEEDGSIAVLAGDVQT